MNYQIVKETVQIEDREFRLVNYSLPWIGFDKGKVWIPASGHIRFIVPDVYTFEELTSYLKSLNEIVSVKIYRHTPFKTELFFEADLKFTNSNFNDGICLTQFIRE